MLRYANKSNKNIVNFQCIPMTAYDIHFQACHMFTQRLYCGTYNAGGCYKLTYVALVLIDNTENVQSTKKTYLLPSAVCLAINVCENFWKHL